MVDSKLLSQEPLLQRYSLLFVNNLLFVTAALRNEYESHTYPVSATRTYQIAHSTSVQQVESYGRHDQRILPPGKGKGFLWRLESISRYEERDGGVYMELEALALSRDIPPCPYDGPHDAAPDARRAFNPEPEKHLERR